MAITKDEIFRAADELVGAGQAPTYLAVRAKLGSGSFGTLQKYLRAWREERERARAAGIEDGSAPPGGEDETPERFQSLATRLARDAWAIAKGEIESSVQALRSQADEEIHEARREADAAGQTVDALQSTLEELTAELKRVSEELTQSSEARAHVEGEKARCEEMLRASDDTLRRVTGELTIARERIGRVEAEAEANARELHAAQVHQQELKRERDDAREEIAHLRSEKDAFQAKYHQQSLEVQEAQLRATALTEALGEATREREALREKLDGEKEAHGGTLTQLGTKIHELSSQLQLAEGLRVNEKESLERALAENKELRERMEGLNKELKEVIAERATLAERLRSSEGDASSRR